MMPVVTLAPLPPDLYATWYAEAVRDYAEDHRITGQVPAEQAQALAERQFRELLPDGLATPGHSLRAIVDEHGTAVGVLWWATRPDLPDQAFIYDIVIFPPYRRRGYAREALLALESLVRASGQTRIGLHVFGHNTGAIRLYQELGYVPTNLLMKKDLGPAESP